ncbi:MAG TPA: MotA/TolQ/ExbB proton channel family protein [Bdellovibrionota bacterium]|jgi:biopolymer transport protein ExbB/TolQ|nr:MotA/TolQ/ExbB proton channel family protein [Bdellovibrionota bacterium]
MWDGNHSISDILRAGGFAMYPLAICSLLTWGVIFERLWRLRVVDRGLEVFQVEALRRLGATDLGGLMALCRRQHDVPTAVLVETALTRLDAKDRRLKDSWREAVERERQKTNQALRGALWVLGTVATASPFIGLFGTVVGILQSFGDIGRTGKGGFAVVAEGISQSLVATASGIIVAVVAAIAFNALQVRLSRLTLRVRHQSDELMELLGHGH